MLSDHPTSTAQQAFVSPQPAPIQQATSPPTKQSLKNWWKGFRPPARTQEPSTGKDPPKFLLLKVQKKREDLGHSLYSNLVSCLSRNLDSLFKESPMDDTTSIVDGVSEPAAYLKTEAEVDTQCLRVYKSGSVFWPSSSSLVSRKDTSVFNPRLGSNYETGQLQSTSESQPIGIFGVPLRQSIAYANVAISLVDAQGQSYIYGYVPIVVAKCGVYLKEKATNVEGIFRLSGSEKRIKELKTIFDSPDRYGKGLDWAGYTVHDAANVLRRYLNLLPEPIVPLDLYSRFREPLRGHTMAAVGDSDGSPQFSDNFDVNKAIITYQQLITELPPLNRQLLLYILDLLAVFASKSDENRMTAVNLAAIFQPGMLSHPEHDMAPAEYRLSQDVLIFLIENQDHFLIGMRGTAADEQTVNEVENGGTPPPGTPTTPGRSKTTIGRSASNASAGADSVRKFGGIRRNVSVSSRHSRQSNGAPSPASPAYGVTLTSSSSGGVHRSNTVPSKKSPGLPSSRMNKHSSPPSPTPVGLTTNHATGPRGLSPTPLPSPGHLSPSYPGLALNTAMESSLTNSAHTLTSQERSILESNERSPEVSTPSRIVSNLFQRSPTEGVEKRQPNKLRKKRIPGSSNPSAQSSTNSLNGRSSSVSPGLRASRINSDHSDHPRLENLSTLNPILSNTQATPPATKTPRAEQPPHFTPMRPEDPHHPSDRTLRPVISPVSSLHSHSSFNDQSDLDHIEDPALAEAQEKRSLWHMSRRRDDSNALGAILSPKKTGSDSGGGAGASSSSVGSSGRPQKSFTGDTVPVGPDTGLPNAHIYSSNDSGSVAPEERRGPLGWIKSKMREKRDESREKEAERERNKSPPGDRPTNISSSALAPRRKSIDVNRGEEPERLNGREHTLPQ
ncbi:hypothetical protein SBOR_7695 [Sclerotinia borealis F-4128]|uniref:Rho-GAP domain-containing protein n=1 Tax=Sclerotinia borealis (strain F-4128) TaxID=1432307 RepID=W9C7S2_SCLBF|nr:hypothetical protein SBOR_7695 [Sclerotinia borealis F-4128]